MFLFFRKTFLLHRHCSPVRSDASEQIIAQTTHILITDVHVLLTEPSQTEKCQDEAPGYVPQGPVSLTSRQTMEERSSFCRAIRPAGSEMWQRLGPAKHAQERSCLKARSTLERGHGFVVLPARLMRCCPTFRLQSHSGHTRPESNGSFGPAYLCFCQSHLMVSTTHKCARRGRNEPVGEVIGEEKKALHNRDQETKKGNHTERERGESVKGQPAFLQGETRAANRPHGSVICAP